jgi:pimeloyl-ACP methyl ester carboxylesterase
MMKSIFEGNENILMHSLHFALDCSIAYPDLVQKLVLVSPGMSGYTFLIEHQLETRDTSLFFSGWREWMRR